MTKVLSLQTHEMINVLVVWKEEINSICPLSYYFLCYSLDKSIYANDRQIIEENSTETVNVIKTS